ncbi:HPP family protein [Hartmannibacter diazotrophicus]|uniref:HPP family protein n=1 Tax=Hartmannibacter diazotrophicus TaxID=1482074 RepID=A0A2C9D048_9HYPH|nr:HPP family protein [Hartmannibacter diazotrophicus]SON53603.1 HPP family protein [Hartmannibacter diazotrophicus]
MLTQLRHFFRRHEPISSAPLAHLKSGMGGLVGIGASGALAAFTGLPFLIAPFGASAVLLFGQPASPLAQPANVIGGYLVALGVTVGVLLALPAGWPAAALGVGAAIAVMLFLRVTHPPAGAIPIVAATSAIHVGTLSLVVAAGSVLLVGIATLHHWLPPRHIYPRRADLG